LRYEYYYQSFLVKCSSWIGEGRHLDLLDAIPKSEFEPSGTDSPLVQKWPAPCPPNWIPEELTPDLSFLEDLAALLKASPGECTKEKPGTVHLIIINQVLGDRHLFKTLF
jgi:hypothetical protein